MSDRPYSRLYWELLSEFPDVASDPELMGTYSLLLIGADMAWDGKESRPFIPRHVKDTVLARLVALDLVSVEEPTYTIRGLIKERARRSAQASRASNARWNARSNADSNARSNTGAFGHGMPRRDETRQDKKSKEPAEPTGESDLVDTYYYLTVRTPKPTVVAWLDRLASEHGEEAVSQAMARAWSADPDIATFMGRVDKDLLVAKRARVREAEEKRAAAEREYQRKLQEKVDNATPEERERAEKIKGGISEFLKGATA